MNNDYAKKIVIKVFNEISNSRNESDLQNIFTKNKELESKRINENIYPELSIKITPCEIDQLKNEGKISSDNIIIPDALSSLEKLLYSILWKNRDAKKEAHVICGIYSTKQQDVDVIYPDSLVFFQFGRYLANANEPIVDQHTLRACKLYSVVYAADDEKVSQIRSGDKFEESDIHFLRNYRNNLAEITPGFKRQVDRVLYALGSIIKVSNPKK